VDEERLRQGHWMESVLSFLHCFDTIGWATGRPL